MLTNIINALKKSLEDGIRFPMVWDPLSKRASISATTVVVSFGLCTISALIFIGMSLTKLKGDFVITAEGQQAAQTSFNIALQLLITSISFYTVRKLQRDPKGNLSIEDSNVDNQNINIKENIKVTDTNN